MENANKRYAGNKKEKHVANKKSILPGLFASILKINLAVAIIFLLALIVNAGDVTVESGKIDVNRKVYIGNDGNVGIGTTAPVAEGLKFLVNGSIQIGKTGFGSLNNLVLGNFFDRSVAGGILSGAELSWLREAPYRIYALNGIRTDGSIIVETGNVGIGTTSPQSALQVNGYVQLAITSGAPPAADCDSAAEEGRMKFDSESDLLYICSGASGWVSK